MSTCPIIQRTEHVYRCSRRWLPDLTAWCWPIIHVGHLQQTSWREASHLFVHQHSWSDIEVLTHRAVIYVYLSNVYERALIGSVGFHLLMWAAFATIFFGIRRQSNSNACTMPLEAERNSLPQSQALQGLLEKLNLESADAYRRRTAAKVSQMEKACSLLPKLGSV
jgi:hypothetical protein